MSARVRTEIIYTPFCSECMWYGEETPEELEALHDATDAIVDADQTTRTGAIDDQSERDEGASHD